MTPNDCLQLYTALKLHFTKPDYDFVKYGGTLKNPVDYTKRNDKHFFVKLSRHFDPKSLLIANFIVDPSIWIGKLFTKEAEQNYLGMVGRHKRIDYLFSEDIKKLSFVDLLIKNNEHPGLLKQYLAGKISIETMIILDDLLGYSETWNKKITDPVWSNLSQIMKKYRSFFSYNKIKATTVFLELFPLTKT